MEGENPKNKKFNQVCLVIMGLVWIAIALFGLIFDPEKRVIIISLIVIGLLCLVLFIVKKLKKSND
jgi:L-asparagine transporter-like permease